MKLTKIERRQKCDIGGCKNVADYEICHEHGSMRNKLYICRECMLEMYKAIGAEIVPESPKAVFSGAKRRTKGGKVD